MTNTNARARHPFQNESVLELISASRATLSDFVVVDLALGLTYCATANLTNSPEKRHHLLTLAHEVLATVETYMELAPPERFTDVLENADRLRSAIAQLEKESRKQKAEGRTPSCSSLLPPRD